MDFDFTLETITPDNTTLLTIGGSGALELPSGTTAQRPGASVAGAMRWNTTTPQLEYYNGTAWITIPNSDVTSIVGTANQIAVSPPAGAGVVTLSLPLALILPGSLQVSYFIGVTAAGTNQATATPLTADFNYVNSVASGTGVSLPTPKIGNLITVVNNGANTLLVYPAVGTAIDLFSNGISVPVGQTYTAQGISSTLMFTIKPVFAAGAGISLTLSEGTITYANTGVTSIIGTANQISVSTTTGVSTISLANNSIVPGTASMTLPSGTTAQRPVTPVAGMERWNTTLGYAEVYDGSQWHPYGRVLQCISASIPAQTGTTLVSTAFTAAPTITDGFQIWTQAFTPISATSRIVIAQTLNTAVSTNGRIVVLSCFAGSLNVGSIGTTIATLNSPTCMSYQIQYSPGSVTPITFTCRIGATSTTTVAVSQVNTTTGTMAGAASTEYTITEYL